MASTTPVISRSPGKVSITYPNDPSINPKVRGQTVNYYDVPNKPYEIRTTGNTPIYDPQSGTLIANGQAYSAGPDQAAQMAQKITNKPAPVAAPTPRNQSPFINTSSGPISNSATASLYTKANSFSAPSMNMGAATQGDRWLGPAEQAKYVPTQGEIRKRGANLPQSGVNKFGSDSMVFTAPSYPNPTLNQSLGNFISTPEWVPSQYTNPIISPGESWVTSVPRQFAAGQAKFIEQAPFMAAVAAPAAIYSFLNPRESVSSIISHPVEFAGMASVGFLTGKAVDFFVKPGVSVVLTAEKGKYSSRSFKIPDTWSREGNINELIQGKEGNIFKTGSRVQADVFQDSRLDRLLGRPTKNIGKLEGITSGGGLSFESGSSSLHDVIMQGKIKGKDVALFGQEVSKSDITSATDSIVKSKFTTASEARLYSKGSFVEAKGSISGEQVSAKTGQFKSVSDLPNDMTNIKERTTWDTTAKGKGDVNSKIISGKTKTYKSKLSVSTAGNSVDISNVILNKEGNPIFQGGRGKQNSISSSIAETSKSNPKDVWRLSKSGDIIQGKASGKLQFTKNVKVSKSPITESPGAWGSNLKMAEPGQAPMPKTNIAKVSIDKAITTYAEQPSYSPEAYAGTMAANRGGYAQAAGGRSFISEQDMFYRYPKGEGSASMFNQGSKSVEVQGLGLSNASMFRTRERQRERPMQNQAVNFDMSQGQKQKSETGMSLASMISQKQKNDTMSVQGLKLKQNQEMRTYQAYQSGSGNVPRIPPFNIANRKGASVFDIVSSGRKRPFGAKGKMNFGVSNVGLQGQRLGLSDIVQSGAKRLSKIQPSGSIFRRRR